MSTGQIKVTPEVREFVESVIATARVAVVDYGRFVDRLGGSLTTEQYASARSEAAEAARTFLQVGRLGTDLGLTLEASREQRELDEIAPVLLAVATSLALIGSADDIDAALDEPIIRGAALDALLDRGTVSELLFADE